MLHVASAQDLNVTQQLLRRSLQAHLGSVVLIDMEVMAERTDLSGREPMRLYIKGSKSLRSEKGQGLTQTINTFSEGLGWTTREGKTESTPDHAVPQRIRMFPFFDLITEVENPRLEMEYRGLVLIDGVAAHQVHLRLPDEKRSKRIFGRAVDEEADFFIHPQTFLVIATTNYVLALNDMDFRARYHRTFTDYRNVAGVLAPFRITTAIGTSATGVHTSTLEIQTVLINRGVSPALFERGIQ
jgi:hypothetical protein